MITKETLQNQLKNVNEAIERARTVFNQLQGQKLLLEQQIAEFDKPAEDEKK